VGHSTGCAFLTRWLGDNKQKIKKLILVAPYIKDDGIAIWLKAFVNFQLNNSLNNYSKKISIFYDEEDMQGIIESVKLLNENLDCQLIKLKDHGHFTQEDMGTNEFPELLKEILG
jgi:predicted alpha/beta hydrolase family esterase